MQDISLLEELHARGLIPVEEYNIRRVQIIDRITNTVYASNGAPVGMQLALNAPTSAASAEIARQLSTAGVDPVRFPLTKSSLPLALDSNIRASLEQKGDPVGAVEIQARCGGGDARSPQWSPILMAPLVNNFHIPTAPALPPIDTLTARTPRDPKIAVALGHATPPGVVAPPPQLAHISSLATGLPVNLMHPPAFRPLPVFPAAPPPPLPPIFRAPEILRPLATSSTSDLHYSVSSGHSSEDESSDGDYRRVVGRRAGSEEASPSCHRQSAIASVGPDLLLPPAAKRQKVADSICSVDTSSPLANLAALATSAEEGSMSRPQSYADSQKTILQLKEELRESKSATHEAHLALNNYIRRDEEMQRISNLSQYPAAFQPQSATVMQQQTIWATAPIHMAPAPSAIIPPGPRFSAGPKAPKKHTGASPPAQPIGKLDIAASQKKANIFSLEITNQPPPKVVYQRILKPFPQLEIKSTDESSSNANLPASMWNNLYIEATLLRGDTHEPLSHVDGTTMVRVWNGVATFRKLKIMSTSQQIGTVVVIRFSLMVYEGNEFFPVSCAPVMSSVIEVFSHSQYLKGSNARETDRALKAAIELGAATNPSIVSTAQSTAIKNVSLPDSNNTSNSDGGSSASSSNSGTRNATPATVSPPNEQDVELLVGHINDSVIMRTGCDAAETTELAKTNPGVSEGTEVELAAASS